MYRISCVSRRLISALALSITTQAFAQGDLNITPAIEAALDRISAESMEKHLTYLASDELGGRDTPSPGLDLAAEYIAEQFAKAGLEPAGDQGYFQSAPWSVLTHTPEQFAMTIRAGGETLDISAETITCNHMGAIEIDDVRLIAVPFDDEASLRALDPDDVRGQAILTDLGGRSRSFSQHMARLEPAVIIAADADSAAGGFEQRLVRAGGQRFRRRDAAQPTIRVHDARVQELLDEGVAEARITIRLEAAVEKRIVLRNVIGLLPGSDAVLKDEYILVTAHYDHVGVRPGAGDDAIYNGANDDGSGTVSVIEIASALATLEPAPKRSIVFMTFFGEEKGLLGSRYYGANPVFPLEHTIADVNLEQIGRTDSTEGPQIGTASMTGIDYSEVGAIFQQAGRLTGIEVYKHPRNSDAFFGRSDNQAMADQGIPAHTLCVAYQYPDYHQPGDHADRVDYQNMAAVDRMVALGILMICERKEPPRWNGENPRAKKYLEAWRALHEK